MVPFITYTKPFGYFICAFIYFFMIDEFISRNMQKNRHIRLGKSFGITCFNRDWSCCKIFSSHKFCKGTKFLPFLSRSYVKLSFHPSFLDRSFVQNSKLWISLHSLLSSMLYAQRRSLTASHRIPWGKVKKQQPLSRLHNGIRK